MALRNAKPFVFVPKGLSDADDATTAFPGAMSSLQNLVPNPSNDNQFVPRAASIKITNFSGFTTPGQLTALIVVGNIAWGMISTARNAGKDEPFCYNIATGAFITIGNVTAANSPTSPATTGDWTPPCIVPSTSGRLTITHPGYNGTTTFIGWIDISSFSSTGITGATHTSTAVDGLSGNVLLAGWSVGMLIGGAGIPATTYIKSIAADGLSLVLSQAATATAAGVALTVTGGTPAAPLYGAGNTNGNALPAVPLCVGVFNSRTWYGVNNFAVYSDTLNPQQVTNASQALALGDNTPVTAISPFPLTQGITGGIVQALVIFKGAGNFFQITGDAATNNLAQNIVAGSVGTLAPNTICGTPTGLAFVAPDGLRQLTFGGILTPPIGRAGMGVHTPFTAVVNPSRMAASFNNNVIRISCTPLASPGQTPVAYWYDVDRAAWTGPHTFPSAIIRPYYGGTGDTFILAASGIAAALWQAVSDPTPAATYTENGVALQWAFTPTLLPDNREMASNSISESSIGLQMPAGQRVSIVATDEEGNLLDQQIVAGPSGTTSVWDNFNWGGGVWGSSTAPYRQNAIEWSQPLVARQMIFNMTGMSSLGFIVGTLQLKYQRLGYQLP